MADTYLILPSLLSANLMILAEEVTNLLTAGADLLHLDIMDNHYVPNVTFGPDFCHALHQKFPHIAIDVHLMTRPVDTLITRFAKAGALRISIHPDASSHLDRSLSLIRELGCQAGLVLNPSTGLDILPWSLHRLDFITVMTVNPGFAGQSLIPEVIPKIAAIHQHFPLLPICVDGGITVQTIGALAKAGASQFVAGSAVFAGADYKSNIHTLRQQAIHAKL